MAFFVKKLNALPGVLAANTMYLIKSGTTGFKQYVTDSTGTVATGNVATSFDVSKYDLPSAASTGAMNLAANQIFKVDLSTTGVRTVVFSGAPAGRNMVIVVETIGAVGSIIFPANVSVASGVDTAPGGTRSIFTIFYDGANYTLINNSKVD